MTKAAMLILMVAVAGVLGGCGPETEQESESGMPMMDEEGMPMTNGEGMRGMAMGQSGGMMEEMAAHMNMMAGMPGDSLMARMPLHRQMTANMIARMNREMRDMDMPADAAWSATVDSLRNDLVRMPEMDAAELEQMMPEHRARATRLMEMHRRMMADMEN